MTVRKTAHTVLYLYHSVIGFAGEITEAAQPQLGGFFFSITQAYNKFDKQHRMRAGERKNGDYRYSISCFTGMMPKKNIPNPPLNS